MQVKIVNGQPQHQQKMNKVAEHVKYEHKEMELTSESIYSIKSLIKDI